MPGADSPDSAERVGQAMAAIRREWFLPPGLRAQAGRDEPLPIGHGATNSQPSTVACMLRWLDVRPGDRVLDVGAGSGWTTALLAWLTGPGGTVIGVECEGALVERAAANVAAADLPWARVEAARADALGCPEAGPWDRILVSAMATGIPAELVAQLTPEGIMVCPVGGRMCRVRRRPGEPDEVAWSGYYRFVPLRGGRAQPR